MARPDRLTVGERIVVHLFQFARHADAFVCPPEMAQAGIAADLGISRAHAAIELRRQMDAGRVAVRLAHVKGLPTRRKVYHLTERGRDLAREVRRRATTGPVEIALPDGSCMSVPGERAFEVLRRHGVGEGRAILLLASHQRVDVLEARRRRPISPAVPGRSAEVRAHDAFTRTFRRPYAWHLDVVLGPPHAPPVPAAA